VAEGIDRVAQVSAGLDHSICPLCAQDLRGSSLIGHYRAYFSQAYATLRQDITNRIKFEEFAHGGDAPAAFERNYRTMEQDHAFWANFLTLPELALDTAAVARAWKAAREAVLATLRTKENAPLDDISLSPEAREALDRFEAARQEVETASAAMLAANAQIAIVKEQARSANIAALTSDLTRSKAVRARFDGAIAPLCQAYLDEKNSKTQTETERDQARDALNQYRQRVFPTYESAINGILQRFGASFRLGNVTSVNNRAGSSCNYSVVINNVPVGISAAAGQPSFRNTLSAGDRNALALAFFFASLDSDSNLAQKIVVIDDPMTSLDDHRSLTTVQELRRLVGRVRQVIVLSHSKPFLCELWTGGDRTARTAIRIVRSGSGSDLAHWDVRQDLITLHDKNYEEVASYITVADSSRERTVAAALRPMLEAFMRVSYPSDFPPGALLGPFINVCDQRLGQANQLLNSTDIPELRDLLDYANRFHHDSNPTCDTELINDQQLAGFCRRTFSFIRRP
jgi:wobble nucleotide-excising tRNase